MAYAIHMIGVELSLPHNSRNFFLGLSDHRSPEEKAKIVDAFFKRYENQVAKHPEDHGMDYVHAYLVIAKSWLFRCHVMKKSKDQYTDVK